MQSNILLEIYVLVGKDKVINNCYMLRNTCSEKNLSKEVIHDCNFHVHSVLFVWVFVSLASSPGPHAQKTFAVL